MTFSEFPETPEIELSNLSSQELIARWKLGDSQAANVLADRYSARLVALVASRLNRRYQQAVAPEEVVQSAMGSFFRGVATSKLRASRIHSVWSLLATFAKRKMLRAIEREKTMKRGGHLARVPFDESLFQQFEPRCEAADQLQELLEELLDSQDDRSVAVLGAMLDGRTQQEIATELSVSKRTIRRCLEVIRSRLSEATRQAADPADSIGPGVPHSHEPTTLPRWTYGQFILRRMIGQGAFGKVYEAVTQNDGSAIAVKFLKREFWQNLELRSMFLREVDQASKVSHPNVVRYLGWGTSPHGGPFIVQQFIDGQPLSQMLGCCPEQFRDWLQEICDALNAIHQQRIIHGDLTPNNILIDRSNQAYLSDFGFSQSYRVGPHASVPPRHSDYESPTDRPALAAGTFGFLAPEQLSSSFGVIGPATDFFALGAIAYWYAFGRSIYAGSSQTEFWKSMLDESTIAMPSNDHDWLHPLIQHCLIKSVSQRPRSIDVLRDLIAIRRD